MRRRVIGAAAAAVLAGGGAWLVAASSGSDDGLSAVAGTKPDVAAGAIAFGATSQFDLSQRAPLTVRVRVPKANGTVLRAAISPQGAAPLLLSSPIAVRAGARTVRVPVSPQAATALARCHPARLTVAVADAGGTVLTRRSRGLVPEPPRCGRFFNARAVWNTDASKAPLDPLSATLVKDLAGQVADEFARNYPPTINTVNYSAPVYTVPASQPRVPVYLVGSRVSYGGALAAQLKAGVPIPKGARAAWGSDHHLVIWQPATDTMWELWVADDSHGRWEAQWGGRMDHVSQNPGYFSDPSGIEPGATATSLPLVGGLITRADLQRGEIDHALALAIPTSRYAVWAHPAQRSDGGLDSPNAIPAGARFRLDPHVDIEALNLPPFTAMLARAAQKYGMYVRDTSGVVTLYAEDPAAFGADPWAAAIKPSAPEVLRAFPWEHLQVTRMDLWTYSNQRVTR